MTIQNILIVDDDKDIIEAVEVGIKDHFNGGKVFTATDGAQALSILEATKIDLLFLDFGLPKYNGGQILKELKFIPRSRHPKWIFMISGNDHSALEVTSKSRVIRYISKPFTPNSIIKKVKATFEEIENRTPTKKSKANFDVKFLNPFVDATVKVIQVTANIETQKESVDLRKDSSFLGDISAYYPIHGSHLQGFFTLSFPESTYLKIMSAMFFEEQSEINDENQDGVAELCNQIFGNAKAEFNDKHGMDIKPGTPTIVIGKEHKIASSEVGVRLSVEFNSDYGSFYIEIVLKKTS